MNQNLKISLSPEELDFILKVIRELPTRTGAWVLLQNLERQVAQFQPKTSESTNEVDIVEEA